jgi:hypothetical protein
MRKENADKVAEEIKDVALGADVTNEESSTETLAPFAAIARAVAAPSPEPLGDLRTCAQRRACRPLCENV